MDIEDVAIANLREESSIIMSIKAMVSLILQSLPEHR
jgi:hypothetical protein